MRKTLNQKYKKKSEQGITLIALVITIIVLLILAGISISMLSGENGIIQQASKAKDNTAKKSTEELIKIATVETLMESEGKIKIEDEKIKENLKNTFGEEGTGYSITGDDENGWTVTVPAVNGEKYKITSTGTVMTNLYDVGTIIKLKNTEANKEEEFYVIRDNGDSVYLLARYCLNEEGTAQNPDELVTCAFSSSNYWSSSVEGKDSYTIEGEVHADDIAIKRAQIYGTKIENATNGRLMSIEDIEELGGSATDNTTPSAYPWLNSTSYWLRSIRVNADGQVWCVGQVEAGKVGSLSSGEYNFYYPSLGGWGVRPVIEITKTAIK